MIKATEARNEAQRLNALYEYDVLDTQAEKAFDDLTTLASEICETPISLISLIDPHRQWFKSKVGLDAEETSRDIAFCSHAILEKELFEVSDALEDERFHDNPLVAGSPNIRFYAGTQLTTPKGFNIGTLCVISDQPKTLNQHQRNALELLGREVITQLELRVHNKKLEESNRYKTEFLSNVSHEIRTPLNAIVGLSDLALKHETAEELHPELLSFLQQINFSGNCMLGIINSILDLGKIEAGKMELEESVSDVRQQVLNTVSMLTHKAREKEIDLITSIEESCPAHVLIDEGKLSQILTNIINNAIKFTPERRQIDVRLWSEDNKLCLEVEDQGVGISEQDLEQLFNKYAQVGKKKLAQEGTGLGLSISKGLVEVMGGSIELTSRLNVGTSVQLSFPVKLQENVEQLPPKPYLTQVPSGLRVLVVEDNVVNQNVIGAMLTKLSVNFELLDNGEAVEQALLEADYDLILMDINLPGISGIEVTRQLKVAGSQLPVIALTADVYCTKREKSLFDSFLTKPIKFELLESEICKVLA